MVRRLLVTLALVTAAGSAFLAAERATFILVNGERVSGTLAFHTNTRELLIDNDFSLAVTPGQPEQIFHYDQVVAIEFLGGTPRQSELAALPEGSGQMLVMRNGDTRYGRFVNIIGGDTVRWKNEANQTQEMPVRDVSRIYLHADNARRIFDYTGPPDRGRFQGQGQGQGRAFGRGRAIGGGPLGADEYEVQASTPWTDTGLEVRRGDRVAFSVRGQVATAENGQPMGPDGNPSMRSQSYPVSAMAVGGLIGKVGNSAPFPIGANRNPITMPANGRLMLGVNDDHFQDNSGAFLVTVTRG
jgi:hypothetical protein